MDIKAIRWALQDVLSAYLQLDKESYDQYLYVYGTSLLREMIEWSETINVTTEKRFKRR